MTLGELLCDEWQKALAPANPDNVVSWPDFDEDQQQLWEAAAIGLLLRLRVHELRAAATAVVQRWDTPLWKDVEPTAEVINRLRAAILAEPEGGEPDTSDIPEAGPEWFARAKRRPLP